MGTATEPSSRDAVHGDAYEGIVDLLRHPSSYPDRTTTVECIETHISWVFLTDRFAYKLKKPVHFDFLDFSTPERRRLACVQEIELNRRLAPDVYLELVPITLDGSRRLLIAGNGTDVDWLVKMRRLPAEAALDQLILNDRLTRADVERIATRLVEFYEQLPPMTIKIDDYRRSIEEHIGANEQALHDPVFDLPEPLIKRVHSAQRRLLRLAPDLLDDRVCDGRVVDGHGDLRSEHIYVTPTPIVIDCIEFNRNFRVVDVIDELGFLAMECDHLGAHWIGERVLEKYRQASGDNPPLVLTQFYQSYRACVRAKVCVLRARQQDSSGGARSIDEARRYLQLAECDATSFAKPLLLVIHGLPGTGKSTLATALADQLSCEVLKTDALRSELFDLCGQSDGFNEGRYRPENRIAVYSEMFRRAGTMLGQGESVILDGTFLSGESRCEAVSLAEQHGAEALLVQCKCPEPIAIERIAERAQSGESLSEARPEFYHRQVQAEEPDPPECPVFVVDTGDNADLAQSVVASQLRTMLFAEHEKE